MKSNLRIIINNLYKRLYRKLFNKRITFERKLKWALGTILDGDFEERYIYRITAIKVHDTKKQIKITIVTERPGLIIGKAGSKISDIQKRLEKYFEKSVDIHLEEAKVW